MPKFLGRSFAISLISLYCEYIIWIWFLCQLIKNTFGVESEILLVISRKFHIVYASILTRQD